MCAGAEVRTVPDVVQGAARRVLMNEEGALCSYSGSHKVIENMWTHEEEPHVSSSSHSPLSPLLLIA